MGNRKFAATIVLAGLLAASAAACAGSASTAYQGYTGGDGRYAQGSVAAAGTAGPAAPEKQGDGSNAGPAATNGPATNITRPEDAIVKTGTIRVEVADLDGAIETAAGTMKGFGAYLSGSDRSRGDTYALASVTYRIPAARFEDALAAVRKLGRKVITEHSETTPVGGQIVDLQARIDNLKTSEKAVQEIMAKASAINDVLAVESRLSDIQGQIEQLTGQLAALTDQSSYSTLTIEFQVPDPNATPTPTPTPAAGWSAGHELEQAIGALASIAQGAVTVLIWVVVVVLPIALAALLLLLLLIALWRVSAPIRRLVPMPSGAPSPAYPGWVQQPPSAQPTHAPVMPDDPQP